MLLSGWRLIIASSMIVMVVAAGLGVVSRLLNMSLSWTEEVARYCLVWMTFLGSAELFRRTIGGHLRVNLILQLLPIQAAKSIRILGDVLIVLVLLALIIGGATLADPRRVAVSAAAGIPMWIVYLAVPVGAGLSLIFLVMRRFKDSSYGHEDS